ncbi:hypothetical protein PQX77_020879, partial [Marasmius sp. AFHP31]
MHVPSHTEGALAPIAEYTPEDGSWRSISVDEKTGVDTYPQQDEKKRKMPGSYPIHGPPHIHSNRWARALAKAHEHERPENRERTGGVDAHKHKGALATDLDAINLVRKHFKICFEYDVTLQTNELDVCEGEMVEVTAEVWDAVKDDVNKLFFRKSLVSGSNSHSPSVVARPIQPRMQHVALGGKLVKDEEERIVITIESSQGRGEFK